jgi:endonuclease-3 related protein
MVKKNRIKIIFDIFERLYKFFGPMHWWPAETPFEVIVGAILTQNTSWKNVEKVIDRLKEKGLLDIAAIHQIDELDLAQEIRSCGYYHIKARRLKHLIEFIWKDYGGNLESMFSEDLYTLREKLLQVNGVGPETADSILLYACKKPIFVIDAYTKRILLRHELIEREMGYDDLQSLFMENLPKDVNLFNEYHALLVNTAKLFCRRIPKCGGCPLEDLLNHSNEIRGEIKV